MRNMAHNKNSISLKSYAKINLSLDVLGRTPDGYHKLCMIMQTVSLYDSVFVEKIPDSDEIRISCANRFVPSNDKNTAYKAAKLLFDEFPDETRGFGLNIRIRKRIPVAAGLAGGSGNAAAVIKAVNSLFGLSLSKKKMCDIGVKVGADIPYCIMGGTMLSEGIGEILSPLPAFPKTNILLVNPKLPLSTGAVFSSIKNISDLPHPDTKKLIVYLKEKNIKDFFRHTANSLEVPAFAKLPVIAEIKNALIELGAHGALMSGSGPTVFGVFTEYGEALNASKYFMDKGFKTFLTLPVDHN